MDAVQPLRINKIDKRGLHDVSLTRYNRLGSGGVVVFPIIGIVK